MATILIVDDLAANQDLLVTPSYHGHRLLDREHLRLLTGKLW